MNIVTSGVLQSLVAAALAGKTAAGLNVFTPRTWPTTADEMPIVLVQSPRETKQNSNGRTGPAEFFVTATIRVVARVSAKAASGDAGAVAAEFAVGLLQRQIEVAVINDDALRRAIQKFSAVEIETGVKSEGGLVFGELVMDFALEFYQGPEAFAPVLSNPFEELAIYADLLNVFSPSGDFADTPFPGSATSSPRTEGPDGRAEGLILIEIDQTAPPPLGAILDFSDPDAPLGLGPDR
jgi:hypothetical protein